MAALLRLFACDDTEELWWRGRDGDTTGPLEFYVNVNDVFAWGCADVERIELPSDLQGLAQAKQDALPEAYGWPTLWAARKRGQRPQGAVYKHLPESIWPLLDACGPERETGLGNPRPRPADTDQPQERP